jgi:hypothetical protein
MAGKSASLTAGWAVVAVTAFMRKHRTILLLATEAVICAADVMTNEGWFSSVSAIQLFLRVEGYLTGENQSGQLKFKPDWLTYMNAGVNIRTL